tara:strand:+ start:1785 stop:3578 length:1794 start_codon:yes stop_codon:yes gene_type:complete
MKDETKKLIRYTNRDFNSIKRGLVDYAKRYYPDVYKDFSEASFGSLMLDTVSYIGDVLSFYLDYQANESFLDTAIEYNNVLRLAEQVGYKEHLSSNSFGVLTMYVICPVDVDGSGPDLDYLPVLNKGSKFSTTAGQIFTLVDDVNFADPNNEAVVATQDNDGAQTAFAIKAYGNVISGELTETTVNVGAFKRFLNIPITEPNITEVVSVVDSEGHEYFEVDYLSQDVVYRSVVNKDPDTRETTPNIIITTSVPRRYTVSKKFGQVSLKFGYGSEDTLKADAVTHPANVVLKRHGRDYDSDLSFDPAKLIQTDKFGISPANTTMTIVYRTNTSDNNNVASRALNTVTLPLMTFGANATDASKRSLVSNSLEILNDLPITGDISTPTLSELKQRATDVFASQNRAVTAEDYEAVIYRMPSKFGKIKRARILRDQDSFKRNLNLYLLTENADGHLAFLNGILKNNVKTWINSYKMVNDTIDILDPKIVNIGIRFTAIVNYDQDKFEALNSAISTISNMFTEKLDIGQPIYITNIYNHLNNLEEIVDVSSVEIFLNSGGLYSDQEVDLKHMTSADGRILYAPPDTVYELRFPNTDIKGTIK